MEWNNQISAYIQQGDSENVKKAVAEALEVRLEIDVILEQGLLDGVEQVCDSFQKNEILLPTVLIAISAFESGVAVLQSQYRETIGTVCMGTLTGDYHDMGKNIVKRLLEAKGFCVLDLGSSVSADSFLEQAIANRCDMICCSISISSAVKELEEMIAMIKVKKITLPVIAGGSVVDSAICEKIGTIYSGKSPMSSVLVAMNILK